MKRLLVVFFLLAFGLLLCAQEQTALSDAGARSWKAAMTLLDMAKTADDLEGPIREFEKVTKSDPNYADTYFNLGKLYTKVGKEEGDEAFNKALENFKRYLSLRPHERQQIEDELYVVESIRKSTAPYRIEKNKKKFIGTWKDTEYPDVKYIIRITENGDSFNVQVSTSNERLLKTYDVRYDGTTLSFWTRDSDDYYWHHQRHEISTKHWKVTCDEEVDYDSWKLTLQGNNINVSHNWTEYYYLDGKTVDSRSGSYVDKYARQ